MGRALDLIWWSAWLSGWSAGVLTCLAAILIDRVIARLRRPRPKENDRG